MPLVSRAGAGMDSDALLADARRRIRQLEKRPIGSFDPNENPVIIGASATAGGGSTPGNVSAGTSGNVAVGSQSQAHGANCIAIGSLAQANVTFGDEGVAIGTHAHATNGPGVAVGSHAIVNAANGVAVGYFATATTEAVAVGDSANAGSHAVAVGYTTATGSHAVAIGDLASASAANAVAVGMNTVASGTDSAAFGNNASATKTGQIKLGGGTGSWIESGAGLVLVDQSTGTRQYLQISSGAVIIGVAP